MQSFHLVSSDEGNAEVPCTGDISARTEPSTPGDPSGSGRVKHHCAGPTLKEPEGEDSGPHGDGCQIALSNGDTR